jgi:hypothetical protein
MYAFPVSRPVQTLKQKQRTTLVETKRFSPDYKQTKAAETQQLANANAKTSEKQLFQTDSGQISKPFR